MSTDLQTTLVRVGDQMGRYHAHGLNDEPFHVGSRGRIYTTAEQRRRLGIDGKGYNEELALLARTSVELVGDTAAGGRYATARVRLHENGEFVLPYAARQYLDVSRGDVVYISASLP